MVMETHEVVKIEIGMENHNHLLEMFQGIKSTSRICSIRLSRNERQGTCQTLSQAEKAHLHAVEPRRRKDQVHGQNRSFLPIDLDALKYAPRPNFGFSRVPTYVIDVKPNPSIWRAAHHE